MDVDEILRILKNGSPEERKEFVRNCPDNSFKDTVVPLAGSDHPGTVVVAMTQLVMQYCSGQNPAFGEILALATHSYALELFESGSDPNLLETTLSGLAFQYVNALNLLGKSEEVILFTDKYIPYYESLEENENLPSLKAARINALLNLNEIDQADEMLNDPNLRGNWSTDIEINRLESKLAAMKRDITDTNTGKRNVDASDVTSGTKLIETMKNAISQSFDNSHQRDELLKAANSLDPTNRIDPSDPKGFQQLSDLLKMGEKFLTKDSSEVSEWTIKQKIREASGIFVIEETPAAEKIRQSLQTLKECLEWSRENTIKEMENDALWGIYLCQSRLNQPSPAADALLQLRGNLEDTREGIQDPLERGGVFSTYSHLFDALCEKLQMAGRTPQLLVAIEASKGRGVADILTEKLGNTVADTSIYGAAAELPNLTREYGFHYLTYYVDQDRCYAVLVSKHGDIHSTEPIEISKAKIREVSQYVDPNMWGHPADFDSSIIIGNTSEQMSPLIQWLEAFINDGIVNVDDHICYSADDNFHNIPLHYLRLRGKPLIETVSLSRIHNASHLQHILRIPIDKPYNEFVSFIVPTKQNVQQANWSQMEESLWSPTKLLSQYLSGDIFENRQGTVPLMKSLNFDDRIVQFSTHGIFPRVAESQTPFYHSGLILSDGKSLPDEDAVAYGDKDYVLTPNKVMELELNFENSHLSMMSCVSGLAREGLAGDALGMDWAFIQAGAASLLSSHWIVSAESAANFFILFYDHWLIKKKSRIQAYCDTVKELRAQRGALSHPHSWAAFSLTGDWR